MDSGALHAFVVRAKKATYVGGGEPATSSRLGSHDLVYEESAWTYRDSYFGGTDFIGQEAVWFETRPIWSMCYFGYIVRSDLITPTQAGDLLKIVLSLDEAEGRLLDNRSHQVEERTFDIRSAGTIERFSGRETIHVKGELAYALDYFGGLIRE